MSHLFDNSKLFFQEYKPVLNSEHGLLLSQLNYNDAGSVNRE